MKPIKQIMWGLKNINGHLVIEDQLPYLEKKKRAAMALLIPGERETVVKLEVTIREAK